MSASMSAASSTGSPRSLADSLSTSAVIHKRSSSPANGDTLKRRTSSVKVATGLAQRTVERFLMTIEAGDTDEAYDVLDGAEAKVHVDDVTTAASGQNAWHVAAMCGHVDVMTWLLDSMDGDPTSVDKDGCNAAHYAAAEGHTEVLDWLRAHRVPMFQPDNRGLRPGAYAELAECGPSRRWFARLEHDVAERCRSLYSRDLGDDAMYHLLADIMGAHAIITPEQDALPWHQPNDTRALVNTSLIHPPNIVAGCLVINKAYQLNCHPFKRVEGGGGSGGGGTAGDSGIGSARRRHGGRPSSAAAAEAPSWQIVINNNEHSLERMVYDDASSEYQLQLYRRTYMKFGKKGVRETLMHYALRLVPIAPLAMLQPIDMAVVASVPKLPPTPRAGLWGSPSKTSNDPGPTASSPTRQPRAPASPRGGSPPKAAGEGDRTLAAPASPASAGSPQSNTSGGIARRRSAFGGLAAPQTSASPAYPGAPHGGAPGVAGMRRRSTKVKFTNGGGGGDTGDPGGGAVRISISAATGTGHAAADGGGDVDLASPMTAASVASPASPHAGLPRSTLADGANANTTGAGGITQEIEVPPWVVKGKAGRVMWRGGVGVVGDTNSPTAAVTRFACNRKPFASEHDALTKRPAYFRKFFTAQPLPRLEQAAGLVRDTLRRHCANVKHREVIARCRKAVVRVQQFIRMVVATRRCSTLRALQRWEAYEAECLKYLEEKLMVAQGLDDRELEAKTMTQMNNVQTTEAHKLAVICDVFTARRQEWRTRYRLWRDAVRTVGAGDPRSQAAAEMGGSPGRQTAATMSSPPQGSDVGYAAGGGGKQGLAVPVVSGGASSTSPISFRPADSMDTATHTPLRRATSRRFRLGASGTSAMPPRPGFERVISASFTSAGSWLEGTGGGEKEKGGGSPHMFAPPVLLTHPGEAGGQATTGGSADHVLTSAEDVLSLSTSTKYVPPPSVGSNARLRGAAGVAALSLKQLSQSATGGDAAAKMPPVHTLSPSLVSPWSELSSASNTSTPEDPGFFGTSRRSTRGAGAPRQPSSASARGASMAALSRLILVPPRFDTSLDVHDVVMTRADSYRVDPDRLQAYRDSVAADIASSESSSHHSVPTRGSRLSQSLADSERDSSAPSVLLSTRRSMRRSTLAQATAKSLEDILAHSQAASPSPSRDPAYNARDQDNPGTYVPSYSQNWGRPKDDSGEGDPRLSFFGKTLDGDWSQVRDPHEEEVHSLGSCSSDTIKAREREQARFLVAEKLPLSTPLDEGLPDAGKALGRLASLPDMIRSAKAIARATSRDDVTSPRARPQAVTELIMEVPNVGSVGRGPAVRTMSGDTEGHAATPTAVVLSDGVSVSPIVGTAGWGGSSGDYAAAATPLLLVTNTVDEMPGVDPGDACVVSEDLAADLQLAVSPSIPSREEEGSTSIHRVSTASTLVSGGGGGVVRVRSGVAGGGSARRINTQHTTVTTPQSEILEVALRHASSLCAEKLDAARGKRGGVGAKPKVPSRKPATKRAAAAPAGKSRAKAAAPPLSLNFGGETGTAMAFQDLLSLAHGGGIDDDFSDVPLSPTSRLPPASTTEGSGSDGGADYEIDMVQSESVVSQSRGDASGSTPLSVSRQASQRGSVCTPLLAGLALSAPHYAGRHTAPVAATPLEAIVALSDAADYRAPESVSAGSTASHPRALGLPTFDVPSPAPPPTLYHSVLAAGSPEWRGASGRSSMGTPYSERDHSPADGSGRGIPALDDTVGPWADGGGRSGSISIPPVHPSTHRASLEHVVDTLNTVAGSQGRQPPAPPRQKRQLLSKRLGAGGRPRPPGGKRPLTARPASGGHRVF